MIGNGQIGFWMGSITGLIIGMMIGKFVLQKRNKGGKNNG